MLVERLRTSRHVLPIVGGLLLIGLLALLPDLGRSAPPTDQPAVEAFRGRIVEIRAPLQDDDPSTPPVPIAVVTALEGSRSGETLEAYLTGPGGSQSIAGYEAGDEVVVTVTQAPDGAEAFVAVSDRWRLPYLQGLVIAFAAAVIVVGGWHGARALVALGLTIAVILKVLLPLVINGAPPVPLAVLAATGVTLVTIGLTEGIRRASLAAILGTAGALAVTGLLGTVLTAVMGFTYTAGSDLAFLSTQGGQGLDLRGVLLAAFILGAVGVLDDVTVTQAALVDELADKAGLGGRELVSSAMSIGRSHIAATVNTLFLAYVGAGLPLLVVLLVSRQPADLILNDETIATEIVRTLVGSLGILTAVPLTTFIAASLAAEETSTAPGWGTGTRRPSARIALVTGAIALLVALTAILAALTTASRAPLAPDPFDPGASIPASPAPSGGAVESPSPDGDEPILATVGEPVPIDIDGEPVGTIVVLSLQREAAGFSVTADRVVAVVEYAATAPYPMDSGRWEVLLDDGSVVALVPVGEAPPSALAPGDAVTLEMEGPIPPDSTSPFLVFVDSRTSAILFAVAVE